jgi:hypothetical protein
LIYGGGHFCPPRKVDLRRRSKNNRLLKSIYGGGHFKTTASKNSLFSKAGLKEPTSVNLFSEMIIL